MEGIWGLLQTNCGFLAGACDLPSTRSRSSSDSAASLRSEWAIMGVDQSQPWNTWALQDSRTSCGDCKWNICNCVQAICTMSNANREVIEWGVKTIRQRVSGCCFNWGPERKSSLGSLTVFSWHSENLPQLSTGPSISAWNAWIDGHDFILWAASECQSQEMTVFLREVSLRTFSDS